MPAFRPSWAMWLCLFLTALPFASSAQNAPPTDPVTAGTMPIIDAHGHLNGDMSAEELVSLMDAAGVKAMVLMARYYSGSFNAGNGRDEQAASFAAKHPGRFIPFVSGQRGDLGGNRRDVWEGPTPTGDQYLKQA